jgi:hypothetical protein
MQGPMFGANHCKISFPSTSYAYLGIGGSVLVSLYDNKLILRFLGYGKVQIPGLCWFTFILRYIDKSLQDVDQFSKEKKRVGAGACDYSELVDVR